MFSLLNNVPDDVEIQFQKNVTYEDEQFVLSGNKLSAIESSLLVLAPDLSPANKLTATESSTLLPVPPILINSKVLPEPQHHIADVFQVSKCTQEQKSIFNYISSMKMDQEMHLLSFCNSTSVKNRMSMPAANRMPVLKKQTAFNMLKPVLTSLIQYIEEKLVPVTHISRGVNRSNPLFNPTGKKGDKHLLCSPPSTQVKRTFIETTKQKSNFAQVTFIVDDTPVFRKLFRDWDLLQVDEHYKDISKPICVFTWTKKAIVAEPVLRYTSGDHSMKFKGLINGTPVCILMDTGASGTAFIDRGHCKEENIPLYPAQPGQFIVLGDNSRVEATDMATISIKMGTYKSKVECLVVDKLAGYPLILGNPWLLENNADMSFLRKQVVLQKPNGQQICLNSVQKKTSVESENYLGLLGEGHLYKMGTYNSTVNLLSTKKVVRLIKKDQLSDAFLLLVQEDNTLQDIPDHDFTETVRKSDIYTQLIPGNTTPEK
jgi:hypothetical protein